MTQAPSINYSELQSNCIGLFYLTNQGVDAIAIVRKILQKHDIHFVFSKLSNASIFRVLYEESTSSEWFDHKIALVAGSPVLAVVVKGPPDTPEILNNVKGNFDGSDIGTLRHALMKPARDIRKVCGFNVYNTQIHTSDQKDIVRDLSSFMDFDDLNKCFTSKAIEYLFEQYGKTLLTYNPDLAESIVAYLAVQTRTNRLVETVIRISNGYFFPSGAPIHMQVINRVLSTVPNLKTFHLFYVDDPLVKVEGFRVLEDKPNVTLVEVFATHTDSGGRLFDPDGINTRLALEYVLKNCNPDTTVGVVHIVELDQADIFTNVMAENSIPYGSMNHLSNRLVESQLSQKVLQGAELIGCVSPIGFPSRIHDKYFPLLNVIDTEYFRTPKEHNRLFRGDQLLLVHLGRFCREKGQFKTVELFNRLIKEGHNVRLILAGPDDDPDERSRVTDFVCQLKLEDSIQILPALPANEVRSLLSKADLLLLPSHYDEGIPRVLLEASSMGVPFISSSAGGSSYAVDKKASVPNGVIVGSGSIDEFYRELVLLIEDRGLLQDMKQSGPNYIREVFGLKKMLERHLTFLETIRIRGNSVRLSNEIDRSALLRSSSIAMPSMAWLADQLAASGHQLFELPTVEKINLEDTSYRSSVSTILINGERCILKGYDFQSLNKHKSHLIQYENTYPEIIAREALVTVFPFTKYRTAERPILDVERDRFFSIWDFVSGRRLQRSSVWETFGKDELFTLGRDIGNILNGVQRENTSCDGLVYDWFETKRISLKTQILELNWEHFSEPLSGLISDHLEILEEVGLQAKKMANETGRIGLVPNDLRRRNFLFNQDNTLKAVFDLSLDDAPIISALAPTLLSFGYEANGNYRDVQFNNCTQKRVACLKEGFSLTYERSGSEMPWIKFAISALILKRLITDLDLFQKGILKETYVLSVSRISHHFLRDLLSVG